MKNTLATALAPALFYKDTYTVNRAHWRGRAYLQIRTQLREKYTIEIIEQIGSRTARTKDACLAEVRRRLEPL